MTDPSPVQQGLTPDERDALLNHWRGQANPLAVLTSVERILAERAAEARAEIERLTRERDDALEAVIELAEHVGTQAAHRAQAENERDEWKRRRDNAIALCRFRHQDGLTAEEWHTRICGAMQGVQEERARAERAEAKVAACEALAEEWASYAPSSWDEPAAELRAALGDGAADGEGGS